MRLIALFCILAAPITIMAQPLNGNMPPSLREQISYSVKRAAAKSATDFDNLVARAKTTVRVQHQYQEEGYSSLERAERGAQPDRLFRKYEDTTCSALLLNANGLVAVKKDCVPIMKKDSGNYHGYFDFLVRLSKLGTFTQNVEHRGAPLYYKTEEFISLESFKQPANVDYILFYMPLNADIKAGLEKLFPIKDALTGKRVEITAEQAQKIIKDMPSAQTKSYAHDESYLLNHSV